MALAAGIIAVFSWATVFVAGRFALVRYDVSPVHLAWARFLIATPVLWLLLLARGRTRAALDELKQPWSISRYVILAATGCFGMTYFQALALPYVQATTLSLLLSTAPITTALLGYLVGERLERKGITGVILGFAGAVIISVSMAGHGERLLAPPWPYFGEVMSFLSGTCWAVFTIAGKKPSRRAGGLVSTTLAVTVSNVLFLLAAPVIAAEAIPRWQGMVALVYVGVFPTAIGFALWYFALRHMEAGRLAVLQYLNPVMAYCMAFLLMGETITPGAIGGFVLVAVAVRLATRSVRKVAGGPEAPVA